MRSTHPASFKLLDDLRIGAAIPKGTTTASRDRVHGVNEFKRRFRLLAEVAVIRAPLRIPLPFDHVRRDVMRNAASHTLGIDNIKSAGRIHGVRLVRRQF